MVTSVVRLRPVPSPSGFGIETGPEGLGALYTPLALAVLVPPLFRPAARLCGYTAKHLKRI